MEQCQSWMKDPTAKCLYWGLLFVLLLIVLYHLRNPESYSNPHWIDRIGSSFSTSNLDNAAHGAAAEDIAERFQDPDWINGIGSNFSTSNLDNAVHGSAPENISENFIKFPLGSERLASSRERYMGVPGPSRESMINIDDFQDAAGSDTAGLGKPRTALAAALSGGSAYNVGI